MTTALVKQVMALRATEKLDLINKIWESMSTKGDELEVSEEEKANS
jgi:hypothetical protein